MQNKNTHNTPLCTFSTFYPIGQKYLVVVMLFTRNLSDLIIDSRNIEVVEPTYFNFCAMIHLFKEIEIF